MLRLMLFGALLLLSIPNAMAQDSKSELKPYEPHHCAKRKPFRTQIIYNLDIKPTRYIYNYNRKMLTNLSRRYDNDWYDKHKDHVWVSGTKEADWHTEGLTRGSVRMNSSAKYRAKPYDKYGMYLCPYITQVIVNIEYQSEIFVASEFKKDSCDFKETFEHEMRHHDTNVSVVKTLAKRMEADTPKLVAFMEGRYIPRGAVDGSFDKLSRGINDALKIYLDEIMQKREEFNGLIDTPEEYKRLSMKCR